MLIYQDRISGDELLTDSFPHKEIEDGMLWEVDGKTITIGEGDESREVIDIVDAFKLEAQPSFPDKEMFIGHVKKYTELLTPKLTEEDQEAFKNGIEGATNYMLSKCKLEELLFFGGESMNPDGALVVAYYKEDGYNLTFLYLAHGLKEVEF